MQTQIKTFLLKISTPVNLVHLFLIASRPIIYASLNDPAKCYNM